MVWGGRAAAELITMRGALSCIALCSSVTDGRKRNKTKKNISRGLTGNTLHKQNKETARALTS